MIRGELTNLRAVERSDSGLLHRWLNDPELMRFWGEPDSTVSLAEIHRRIEEWIADEGRLGRPVCLIAESIDSAVVGMIILSQYEPRIASAEISLLIGERERWGEGLGTDVLSTMIDVSFEQWALRRLTLRVEAFNERAIRLYEKCGFQRDGVLRDESYFDGEYRDVWHYSLLVRDLAASRGSANDS